MTESEIDERIAQCESDIEVLEENLEELKRQKEEEKGYIFKPGDVAISESGCFRVIIKDSSVQGTAFRSINNLGELLSSRGQIDFKFFNYKKITTLTEIIDYWRENHD